MSRFATTRTPLIALSLAGALLSGCFENNNAPDSPTEGSATASLGVVADATVTVYAADGSTVLATGITDGAGQVQYQVAGYAGPVVIEIAGDDDASYYDEASGTAIAFPAPRTLRAMAPSVGGDVAVTLLTELAVRLAESRGEFPLVAGTVDATNDAVRDALAPGLSDLLAVPAPFDAATTSGSLDDDDAGRYALVLAALANLASGDATPALTVLDALVQDIADGVIDSANDGAPLTTPYADFINEMSQGLDSFATDFGTPALQASAAQQAPASTRVEQSGGGGNDGPNGITQAATVNASLQAQYTLNATAVQPGSPFAQDEQVMVIVGSDNSLTVGDGAPLSDPFNRELGGDLNTAEIIWLDEANQIEYVLSNNDSGSFNEINVGDASQPGSGGVPAFLAQLVESGGGGGEGPANIELVQSLAGSYTVTEVLDGSHDRGTVIIDAEGNVDYDTGLGITVEQIDAVYDRLDCCSRITIETTADGSGPRIDLFVDGDGALERVEYFTAGFGSDGSEVAVSADAG